MPVPRCHQLQVWEGVLFPGSEDVSRLAHTSASRRDTVLDVHPFYNWTN